MVERVEGELRFEADTGDMRILAAHAARAFTERDEQSRLGWQGGRCGTGRS